MLSTFASYQFYTRDMPKTLDRIASDPTTKRDADYYQSHIHEVKTLDDFMGDYRLYSYAMKAYGLEDQIGSRALVRKVLASDLTDKNSFANKLSDERYRALAKAFTFSTASAVKATPSAQTTDQSDRIVEAYSENRIRSGQALSATTKAYTDTIGNVTSVDAFLDDSTLFNVALTAVGINPAIASRQFIRDVLTGSAADGPAANGDDRYTALAAMLPFHADGSVPAGGLQSTDQSNTTAYAFLSQKGAAMSPRGAAYQVDYYDSLVSTVSTADEFVANPRLVDVALTSVGLNPNVETPAYIWQVLTSDPADPNSTLNTMPTDTDAARTRKAQFEQLASSYNFDTQGNVPAGLTAQNEEARKATVDGYFANYQNGVQSDDRLASVLFKAGASIVSSALAFVSNPKLFDYALKAFDLDPAKESRTTIMRVLRSDPSDPTSFVNSLKDERYVKLAAAFNFGADGKLATPRIAQTAENQVDTADRYAALLGDKPTTDALKSAKQETEAYRAALSTAIGISDFVANKTIATYTLKAYGLDKERLSQKDLTAILTSDLSDPKSFANASGDRRYVELAAAYSFTTTGAIKRDDAQAQTARGVLETQDFYLRQQLEEEAGADNQGVRLALYFRRTAPSLTSVYEILADTALLDVVKTAVGLPDESGQADIDIQKRTIEKKLDLNTLKDPKGLELFIGRFLALYEAQNNASSPSAAALILGASDGSSSVGGLF